MLAAICFPAMIRAEEPPQGRSTDEQLLKRLDANPVDDYDRALLGGEQKKEPAGGQKKGQTSAKPAPADKPDQERLQRELGAAAVPEDANPLLDIARQMRAVEGRMAGNDAGPATQAAQQQIISRLDKLLEQACKACQSSPSQCKSQGVSPRQPTRQPGQPPKKNGSGTPGPNCKPVTTPNAPQGKTEPKRVNKEQMRAVLETLPAWGELSPHQREQMLQLPPEDFLPKYQEMIEDYYRRLSEPPAEGAQP
jgi:hypothetical protein